MLRGMEERESSSCPCAREEPCLPSPGAAIPAAAVVAVGGAVGVAPVWDVTVGCWEREEEGGPTLPLVWEEVLAGGTRRVGLGESWGSVFGIRQLRACIKLDKHYMYMYYTRITHTCMLARLHVHLHAYVTNTHLCFISRPYKYMMKGLGREL